jgi:hypothetical protein
VPVLWSGEEELQMKKESVHEIELNNVAQTS